MGEEHAGVVDQHVQAAEPGRRGVDGAQGLLGVGQVGSHGEVSVAGQPVQGPGGLALGPPVVHRHPIARRRERLGHRPADPARPARDEDGAAHRHASATAASSRSMSSALV